MVLWNKLSFIVPSWAGKVKKNGGFKTAVSHLISILHLRQDGAGMYERTKVFFKTSIEIEEKHTGRYGAPGMKRAKRKKPTPEQMERQNQWKKEKAIRHLLKENFDEHDYWITLTYKKDMRPETQAQAKEQVQKFLRKMRDQYKKRNVPLRYIAAIEIGSRGGIHCHIVMNRIEGGDVLVAKHWPHGHAAFSLLYLEGGFRKLANYIAKNTSSRKWYSRSRNLRKPRTKKRS